MTASPHRCDYPRSALITGAARRIGRALALALAEDGYDIAIHYRSTAEEAERLAEEIGRLGQQSVLLSADLAQESDVESLVERATAALGPVGVLINNASTFEMDKIEDTTRESWDKHLEPNLRAPFLLTQRFAAALPEGSHGAVINLLDQRVWSLTPYFISYTVSKSALWALTRSLALALAPRIRVNAIGPGPTLPSPRQSEAQFARQVASVPLKCGPSLDEVARTARFILSAASMTGQMIALDGGQHLGWRQDDDRGPSVE